MQSKLGLPGRTVAPALWLQSSTRGATRPPGTQRAAVSCRVSERCLDGQSPGNIGGRAQTYNVMLQQILPLPNLSPPIPCQLCPFFKFRYPYE